jgi:endoglycosylceramidase
MLFHGFNSVKRGPTWFDYQILNETRLKIFKDWGFNFVRLGTMWSGIEPKKGQFNETHLALLKRAVNLLDKYGLYALLDMHQDEFSSLYNAYDGIPIWITKTFPPVENPFPWPFKKVDSFSPMAYLTQSCSAAFQNLYDNYKGARDALVAFWVKVASTFKNSSNVIGYELINEPWAGDIYKHPSLIVPGNPGRYNLMPMYDRLNAAIRKVDNTTLIFYEPVTWGVWFNGTGTFGTGFDTVPGGPAFVNKSVLSWHYYCWLLGTGKAESRPYKFIQRLFCDGILGTSVFNNVVRDVKKTGGSSFMTEFGICETNTKYNKSTGNIECNYVMDMADEFLQSWAYWDLWIYFTPGGAVNWTAADAFIRPYARATAGIPKSMKFDIESRIFRLDYEADPKIKAPTVIFIPKFKYPKGISVLASHELDWAFDSNASELLVKLKKNNSVSAQGGVLIRVSVVVTPKK